MCVYIYMCISIFIYICICDTLAVAMAVHNLVTKVAYLLALAGQHCSSCSMPAAGRGAGAITLCSEDAGTLQGMPESCQHCYRWSLPKCMGSWPAEIWQNGEMGDVVSGRCKLLAVSGVSPLYTAEALHFLLSW